ncbi:hypothetical protein BKA69DRAFT_1041243 [Paraphysoderma sedebokerense]|nr:hypothetical protein BKA69DRAFT_1041243 [Paraphysoderma sedebokerense]
MKTEITAFLLVVSSLLVQLNATPAPAPAPLAPAVIGMVAGATTTAAVGVTAGIGGHAIHSQRRIKNARLEWVRPSFEATETWNCGSTVEIEVATNWRSGLWGIDHTRLSLVDPNNKEQIEVMTSMSRKFIKPNNDEKVFKDNRGRGTFSWTIPSNIKSGEYKVRFQANHRFDWEKPVLTRLGPRVQIQCHGNSRQYSQSS